MRLFRFKVFLFSDSMLKSATQILFFRLSEDVILAFDKYLFFSLVRDILTFPSWYFSHLDPCNPVLSIAAYL